jgi:hypothetical protein
MRFLSSLFVRSLGCSAIACGLTFATGCGEASKPAAETAHREGDGHAEHDAHESGHPEEGPHNGHLIELGKEEYHAELVHDDATHTITLYLLDGSAKKMVPIAEKELTINLVADGKPTQFKIPATPQSDDPSGQSSRFELVDETLCEALDDPKSKARLMLTIAGKQFSGDMAHEDHDH